MGRVPVPILARGKWDTLHTGLHYLRYFQQSQNCMPITTVKQWHMLGALEVQPPLGFVLF